MMEQCHSEFPIEEVRVSKMCYFTFVMKQEEPCEGRLSSTVLWERGGETPLRDPTEADLLSGAEVAGTNSAASE